MKVIAVTDRKRCIRGLMEQVRLIVEAGADMVVLREKDLDHDEYLALASEVRAVCEDNGVEFCINTFSDIASEMGVDTVWIPYHDLVENGRPGIGRVGVSVHSEREAYDASDRGADFVVYGNVFETTCKPGLEGRGFDEIRMISVNSDIPVYAIGGIDVGNMQQVHDCMVDGVCIMSGFMTADDPSVIVRKARTLLE
ncbi:MAG: thiamine phosphate synthase [archaeon]|nr:thiamine phosphate synthase [archaeon]